MERRPSSGRVCQEAGATVAAHVPVRDLNVAVGTLDDRRIEVIANGLPHLLIISEDVK